MYDFLLINVFFFLTMIKSHFANEISAQTQTIRLKPGNLEARNVTYSLDGINTNEVKTYVRLDEASGVLYINESLKTGRYRIVTNGHEAFSDETCVKQVSLTLLFKQQLSDTSTTAGTTATTTKPETTEFASSTSKTSTTSFLDITITSSLPMSTLSDGPISTSTIGTQDKKDNISKACTCKSSYAASLGATLALLTCLGL